MSGPKKEPSRAESGRERPEEFSPAGAPGDDPLTQNLKRVYDEVAAEAIPAKWLEMLAALDAKAEKEGDDAGGQ